MKDTRYLEPSYPRVYLTIMRRNAGLSNEELGRRLKISRSYCYFLEAGSKGHKMNVVLLSKIIDVLGVDPKEIIEAEVRYQTERDVYFKGLKNRKRKG